MSILIQNEENILEYGANVAIMIEVLRETSALESEDFFHMNYKEIQKRHPALNYQFFKRVLKRMRELYLIEWENRNRKSWVKVLDHGIFKKEKHIEATIQRSYPVKELKSWKQHSLFKDFPGVMNLFNNWLKVQREEGNLIGPGKIKDYATLIIDMSKGNPMIAKEIIRTEKFVH